MQGVIDLAFLEEDGWVLLDYKTDNLTEENEEKLKKAYSVQLDLYAEALNKITNVKVKEKRKHICVYSRYV